MAKRSKQVTVSTLVVEDASTETTAAFFAAESVEIDAAETLSQEALVEAAYEAELLDAPIEVTVEPTEPDPLVDPVADAAFLAEQAEIDRVLASIDPSMETAATAGVLDHSSQVSSWTPNDVAEEQLLEEAVAAIEAETTPEPIESNEPTLAQKIAQVSEEDAKRMTFEISKAIDERADFETRKNPDNGNIHSTLKKARTQLVTLRAAKLMIAANVDSGFINRVKHQGSAYNVYAIGKFADIVYGVTDGKVANAINLACMRSLFALKRAGIDRMDMETAKGAASKQYAVKLSANIRKHLLSHTVSTSTASTQASSTMQALVTLGVLKTDGAGKNPSFWVNEASPIAQKLERLLEAA